LEKRKRTLLTVFLIVFIDLMGFGVVIPLLPLYGDLYHPSPTVFGLLMATYSLMQFISAPIMGRFSDHYGRKPILLLSMAGTVMGYILFGFQNTLLLLFVARAVNGIAGGNVATAQAVIADVTKPEERARGMGLIGAAFGLGFIFGPAIGGVANQYFGQRAPGFFAAGLSFLALLLTAFALPETWPPERRGERPVGARRGWFSVKRMGQALRHPQIGLLLVIFFLATFAFANFESTFALFLNGRLKLDTAHTMYFFVFVGILAAFIQGGLIGRLVKRFGERKLILTGALLLIPGYLLVLVAHSVPQLMVYLVFLAMGAGFTNPALSSLVSRLSTAEEQGGILGIYQSMSSLARITGPFWGVFAFKEFGDTVPYATAAGVACVVAVLAWVVLARARRAEQEGKHLEVDETVVDE
jgi:MFS transporter, DHA1 family, tetracycline resistance protein